MGTLFKPTCPFPLPADTEILVKDGKPHVRICAGGKSALFPLRKDGKKYLKPAAKLYALYTDEAGATRRKPLSPNKDAASPMLADLLKRVEGRKSGSRDEYADHRKRPLAGLLADYQRHQPDRGNTTKQADQARRR